jgi:hypothetical protein
MDGSVCLYVQAILLDTSHTFILASSSQRGEKGLVLTDCTCCTQNLGTSYIPVKYLVNYLRLRHPARIWPTNARHRLKEFARAVGWPARTKRLTLAVTFLNIPFCDVVCIAVDVCNLICVTSTMWCMVFYRYMGYVDALGHAPCSCHPPASFLGYRLISRRALNDIHGGSSCIIIL